jgi:predicted PurR-regulated permease PerM
MTLRSSRLLFILAVLLGLGWFIAAVQSILLPFVFGILIAYFFDPTADQLQRWGMGRTAATSTILLVFFSILALALIALLPRLVEQMAGLISEMPAKINAVQRFLAPYINRVMLEVQGTSLEDAAANASDVSGQILGASMDILRKVVRSGMAVANLAALLVIAPVVSFYLLRDWDDIIAQLDALLPRYYADTIREQVREMDRVISGFVRGQLKVCGTLALFYAITLSLAGLKYALLISLTAGFLIIIPYAGTFISGLLAVAVALLQFDGDPTRVGIIFGIFVIGQMLEGYILTPKLIGGSVGLHPMWIIFGMLAGGALMGFVGVLIAVPLTAVIGVLVRFAVRSYLKSPFYSASTLARPDQAP